MRLYLISIDLPLLAETWSHVLSLHLHQVILFVVKNR